jgi:hypothetical protein
MTLRESFIANHIVLNSAPERKSILMDWGHIKIEHLFVELYFRQPHAIQKVLLRCEDLEKDLYTMFFSEHYKPYASRKMLPSDVRHHGSRSRVDGNLIIEYAANNEFFAYFFEKDLKRQLAMLDEEVT